MPVTIAAILVCTVLLIAALIGMLIDNERKRNKLPKPQEDERDWLASFKREHDL